MHPTITVPHAPCSSSPRLAVPSLLPLATGTTGDNWTPPLPTAGDQPMATARLPRRDTDANTADRPLARTVRPRHQPQHPNLPNLDMNAEVAAIARLSLALDSAAASSLSLSLSFSPTSRGCSASAALSSAAPSSTSTTPTARAAIPMVRQPRPLSMVNTLPPPTLPTLGPPRAALSSTPGSSNDGSAFPGLPPHEPLSPLGLFSRHGQGHSHNDGGTVSDTDTLSRDERRAASDPAPPYFDPTAHFYPELDTFGNVRVTVPILPDLETRQAVVKMIQMHYVPPVAPASNPSPQRRDAVTPPGALQQGAGDWVLFGHASASSLCYVYRHGAHVVTIALVPSTSDADGGGSPLRDTPASCSNQLIIPLSPRSQTHHARLLGHALSRRNSSAGHKIQVYHAIDKRILPLTPVEFAAAAEVLTFVQRRAHYRSVPKRRPSSASVLSSRSSIHVPLHAPPKYYDLSLHRTATGSPPPFESLGRRPSSVRRLSMSRRDVSAGNPSVLMRRTLSRRGSGRIMAAAAEASSPCHEGILESSMEAVPQPAAVVTGPAAGKRKLGSGFMKRWSRVVGGGGSCSGHNKHHSPPPSRLSFGDPPPSAQAAYIPSPTASHAALAPSSRRSSSSSVVSGQSHASPALNATRVLAPVAESSSVPSPVPAVATIGGPAPCQTLPGSTPLPPPPIPPKDHHHAQPSPSAPGAGNGGGHRLSLSPSMLFKKVRAALPSGSSSSKAD